MLFNLLQIEGRTSCQVRVLKAEEVLAKLGEATEMLFPTRRGWPVLVSNRESKPGQNLGAERVVLHMARPNCVERGRPSKRKERSPGIPSQAWKTKSSDRSTLLRSKNGHSRVASGFQRGSVRHSFGVWLRLTA